METAKDPDSKLAAASPKSEPAGEDFLRDCSSYLYACAYHLTADAARSSDLAQKALIKAWKNFDQLRDPRASKAWLKRICLNEFLMEERKNQASEYPLSDFALEDSETDFFVDPGLSAEDTLIADAAVKDLRDGCFRVMATKLPLEQRLAFSLVDMFGLKPKELALLLDSSEEAVKSLLHRARSNIFRFFSQKCEWINPEKLCKCSAWKSFSHDTLTLKNEVARRKLESGFKDFPEAFSIPEAQKERILEIYRTLPPKKPPYSWYEGVFQALTKIKAEK